MSTTCHERTCPAGAVIITGGGLHSCASQPHILMPTSAPKVTGPKATCPERVQGLMGKTVCGRSGHDEADWSAVRSASSTSSMNTATHHSSDTGKFLMR